MSSDYFYGTGDTYPSESHQRTTWDPRYLWSPTDTETQRASRHSNFHCVQQFDQSLPSSQQVPNINSSSILSPDSAQMLSISFTNSFDAELQQFASDQPSQLSFQQYFDFSSLPNTNSNLEIEMEMMRIDSIVNSFPSTARLFSLPATSSLSSGVAVPAFNDFSNEIPSCLPAPQSNNEYGTVPPILVQQDQSTTPQGPIPPTIQSPSSNPGPSSSSTSPTTSPSSSLLASVSSSIPCPFQGCPRIFSQQHECNRHLKSHTHPCQCQRCCRGFETEKDVRRHINDAHETTRQFFCGVSSCPYSRFEAGGKGFSRKENLRRHVRSKHGGLG